MEQTIRQKEAALAARLTGSGLSCPRYAVVIPIVWEDKAPRLLLEVRAAGISQAGDPCFPGGRIEPGETPMAAARRELREELGISVAPEDILGQLPTVETPLGRQTDVFVCSVSPEAAAAASRNPAEVAVILRPPLRMFQARPHAGRYCVEGHTVWGMTAGAIHHLLDAWAQAFEETDA